MAPTPLPVPLPTPAAPATLQVQGTGELDVKAVHVEVDGSGAGSDYYPTLSIYTPQGVRISRTKVQTAIVAGDSGVVTFGPF